ncbi:SDR family oxidoreductase [Mesorhizobium sp.]|uniref:SDR family NAD(P)-dependent oxidoreductase n=1 Tax=Mesorhizobium sp. TaxID=1871066 RepID=UPI000FE5F68B|nr:SDR family oxidoreductase [Mesorhizobium sp.]RWE79555.1 MAG: SDR family oxidoreductase [Mesorhizobium sp.]
MIGNFDGAGTDNKKPVALVTGALAGIGRATAFAFGHAGYRVLISGRRATAGEEMLAELRERKIEAEFVSADVRFEDQVSDLCDEVITRFGRLDVAVNNAGVDGRFGPISEQTEDSYKVVFDANVLGTLLCMKHEVRLMKGQGFGSIVNLSSSMGIKGAANGSVYTGSKHAVEGITKSVALEVASLGIRVNAVAPGPVDTEMYDRITADDAGKAAMVAGVPMKRIGTPAEIANMIVFVGSGAVPFMTGEIVRVNGGKTA